VLPGRRRIDHPLSREPLPPLGGGSGITNRESSPRPHETRAVLLIDGSHEPRPSGVGEDALDIGEQRGREPKYRVDSTV